MGGRGGSFNIVRDEGVVSRMFKDEQKGQFIFVDYEHHDTVLRDALEFARENGLTDAEARAINMYTATMYMDINRALYGGKPTLEQRSFENTLNNALGKLSSYDGTAYRGTNDLTDDDIKRYKDAFKTGRPVIEKGFISTSKDEIKAFTGSVDFEIRSKKGREITRISKYGDIEDEVLFRSRSKFYVRNVTSKKHGGYRIILEDI